MTPFILPKRERERERAIISVCQEGGWEVDHRLLKVEQEMESFEISLEANLFHSTETGSHVTWVEGNWKPIYWEKYESWSGSPSHSYDQAREYKLRFVLEIHDRNFCLYYTNKSAPIFEIRKLSQACDLQRIPNAVVTGNKYDRGNRKHDCACVELVETNVGGNKICLWFAENELVRWFGNECEQHVCPLPAPRSRPAPSTASWPRPPCLYSGSDNINNIIDNKINNLIDIRNNLISTQIILTAATGSLLLIASVNILKKCHISIKRIIRISFELVFYSIVIVIDT